MSFSNRAKTPQNANNKFTTEYQDCYNTFNKTNYTYFRDKMNANNLNQRYNNNNNNYKPNSYKSFLNSSAPFNYYNNYKNKNGLLVQYNGGPHKQFCPLITNANLSQFFKSRSRSQKFRRPCGCYSNFNISKYTPCYDYYPFYDRKDQYYNNYQTNQLPFIDNENMKYSNGFKRQIRNNGKITYKLKDNYDNENNLVNKESNQEFNKNDEVEKNENNIDNNQIDHNQIHNEVKEEKNGEEKYENKYQFNYFNTKPRRRFHKVQIFNNYKPFLVDDFKEYADYE